MYMYVCSWLRPFSTCAHCKVFVARAGCKLCCTEGAQARLDQAPARHSRLLHPEQHASIPNTLPQSCSKINRQFQTEHNSQHGRGQWQSHSLDTTQLPASPLSPVVCHFWQAQLTHGACGPPFVCLLYAICLSVCLLCTVCRDTARVLYRRRHHTALPGRLLPRRLVGKCSLLQAVRP